MNIVTQGEPRDMISDMSIGDYIVAKYTTDAVTNLGTISGVGNTDDSAIESYNCDADTPVLSGYIYLTKIDEGTLITNHIIFKGVTYADLNKVNLITGVKKTIGGKECLVRVPTCMELSRANTSLDGMMDIADRYTNYDTAADKKELIQENFNLSSGFFIWNTSPATSADYAADTTNAAKYARLVLTYVESDKATDVFH